MSQRIPLAWRQLSFERMKLFTALAGVMVAVMLMWIQLGILAAVYASATEFHRHIQADLVVFHPLSENMTKMKPLSTRTLYRLRGHPDVTEIGELFTAMVDWRVPETGDVRPLMAYGLDPEPGWLSLPGIARTCRGFAGRGYASFRPQIESRLRRRRGGSRAAASRLKSKSIIAVRGW